MNTNILYILNCISTAFVNSGWKEESGDNSDKFIQDMFKRYGGSSSRYGAYCIIGVSNILQTIQEILTGKYIDCSGTVFPVRYTDKNTNKSTILEGNVAATLAALIKNGATVRSIQSTDLIRPGMVFFRPSLNGYNHAGIVVEINPITGDLITIEANVSTSGVDNVRNGFQFISYSKNKFQEWNNQKFKEIPSGIKKVLLPENSLENFLAQTTVGNRATGWMFWMPFENCAAPVLSLQSYPVLGLSITCNQNQTPVTKQTQTTFSACKDVPKPNGNGWEQTGDIIPDANDGYEYSQPDYCWRRKKQFAGTNSCLTAPSPGKGWEKTPESVLFRWDDNSTVRKEQLAKYTFSADYCWRKLKECPIITDKQTCDPKFVVKVYSSTFDSKSVPHYSVLINNAPLAADITGAMEFLKPNPQYVGSAVQAPKTVTTNQTITPELVSGFGTFTDRNGNLYVITHESNEGRLKALIGGDGKLPILKDAYVIVTEGRDNNGMYQKEVEALYVSGIHQDQYGSSETLGTKRYSSVHDLAYSNMYAVMQSKLGSNVQAIPKEVTILRQTLSRIESTEASAIDYQNRNAGYKQFTAINLNEKEGIYLVAPQDTRREGLINCIEDTGKKYDKPILIIIKKAPPRISAWDTFKQFLSVVSNLAIVVGVPPGIVNNVLGASQTLESIARGDGSVVNNAFKLAGVLTSLMPESLRGNIEGLIPIEFKNTVSEVQSFIQKQGSIVGNYLTTAQQYVTEIRNSTSLGNASKLFVPSFNIQQLGTTGISNLLFGGKAISLENLAPKWADFIKANAETAKSSLGSYEKGHEYGVKMLHNLELMKTTQQFVRSAESGSLKTDITDRGTFLGNPIMQNMLWSGAMGAVASAMPGTQDIIGNIMRNASGDIENDTELAALIKIGMGYQPSPGDLTRMTYQAVANRLFDIRDKVDSFVLPPSFDKYEQECVAKDLSECFGITIIPSEPTIPPVQPNTGKPVANANNSSTNTTSTTTTAKVNPPTNTNTTTSNNNATTNTTTSKTNLIEQSNEKIKVTLPKCIIEFDNSFWYCPPLTCATDVLRGLSNSALSVQTVGVTPSVLSPLISTQTISPLTTSYIPTNTMTVNTVNPNVSTSTVNSTSTVLKPNTGTTTTTTNNTTTNTTGTVSKPNTGTTTTQNTNTTTNNSTNDLKKIAQINGCEVLYEARVDAANNWYAYIKGGWIKLVDCCAPSATKTTTTTTTTNSDCCDATKTGIQNITLALAKVTELLERRASGDTSSVCDLSSIQRDISVLKNSIDQIGNNNSLNDIRALRNEISELSSYISTLKQNDYSREFSELRNLIQSIKVVDTKSLESEISEIRKIISTASPSDRSFFSTRFDILEQLISERKSNYEKDYSGELQNLSNQYENLNKHLSLLSEAVKKEIEQKQFETQYNPTAQKDVDGLETLIKEQSIEYQRRMEALKNQIASIPKCEECVQLQKVLDEISELKKGNKQTAQNTVVEKITTEKKQEQRQSNEDCPDCPKMIIYEYPNQSFNLGNNNNSNNNHNASDCNDNSDCNDC